MFIGAFFIVFPLLLAMPIVAAWIHLAPLRDLARQRRLRTQFTLTDILALLGTLGVVGSLVSAIPNQDERNWVMGVTWLFFAAGWFYAVRLLSRAGIARISRRMAIELVAVPLSLFGIYMLLAIIAGVNFRYSTTIADNREVEEKYMYVFWMKFAVTQDFASMAQKVFVGFTALLLLTWLFLPSRLARWAIASEGYVPPPQTSELPQTAHDAPLLDPHVKDLKLK